MMERAQRLVTLHPGIATSARVASGTGERRLPVCLTFHHHAHIQKYNITRPGSLSTQKARKK
jgi:hypothetical protein